MNFSLSKKLFILAFGLFIGDRSDAFVSAKKNSDPACLSADDPFCEYLTGKSPVVIKELGEESDSVKVRKLLFHSRDVNGIATQIFAVVARPLKNGKHPGLLVLHGGGGSAEIDKVRRWAARGYVAVSIDIPGVANPEKVPNSAGNWKSYPYGKNRFTVSPDIRNSTIFDGVLAALQALYLLNNQPDVIKNNLGVSGVSWGGYTTTMICGLASQHIKAGFSTYGSGFYDTASTFLSELNKMPEKEKEVWLKYLDAGRRAKKITAPFFIAAATNDGWFYPPAVNATLAAIGTRANHFFAPNVSHTAPVAGGNTTANRAGWMQMEEGYFDYYLRNRGLPLPSIKIGQPTTKTTSTSSTIRFYVESETPIVDAVVNYTDSDTLWTKKKWIAVKATALKNGWYEALIPIDATAKNSYCFASVSDSRPVTVSSKMIEVKLP